MQLVHQAPGAVPRDRLLREPDVLAITGVPASTRRQLMKEGSFPKSIRVSRRLTCWSEAAVLQWVQDRINDAGRVAPAMEKGELS